MPCPLAIIFFLGTHSPDEPKKSRAVSGHYCFHAPASASGPFQTVSIIFAFVLAVFAPLDLAF